MTVLLRSRKVSFDVQHARDKRSAELEEIIYKRLRGEIDRQDERITELQHEGAACEAKYKVAMEEIGQLRKELGYNRERRDSQISSLERKVTAIQETTGTYPRLEDK